MTLENLTPALGVRVRPEHPRRPGAQAAHRRSGRRRGRRAGLPGRLHHRVRDHGLISAALAAAMVLFFYVVGQLVMVMFADAGARTLLVVSMTSYTGRVVVLGLVLLLYSRYAESWPTLRRWPSSSPRSPSSIGWLAVEIFVFSRLRIGIYDTEYQTPSEHRGPTVTAPVTTASVCSAMKQGRQVVAGRAADAEQRIPGRDGPRHRPRHAGSVVFDLRRVVYGLLGLARRSPARHRLPASARNRARRRGRGLHDHPPIRAGSR